MTHLKNTLDNIRFGNLDHAIVLANGIRVGEIEQFCNMAESEGITLPCEIEKILIKKKAGVR